MSANNQIVIVKRAKEWYSVYENSCVDNEFIPEESVPLYSTSNLESAVRWAVRYQIDYVVEYGMAFIGI